MNSINKLFINASINALFLIYKHIYYKWDFKGLVFFLTEKIFTFTELKY